MKSSKGSQFERNICRQLSLWWTQDHPAGPNENVFWRTSNSGGRATTRGKKGKQDRYHQGDVCAIDPIGQPFLDLVTLELKRGYNRCTLHDLLDKPKGAAKQEWERWIEKAEQTSKQAGSYSWMIIAQRDRRVPLVVTPLDLMSRAYIAGGAEPFAIFELSPRDPDSADWDLACDTLERFLLFSDREVLATAAERYIKGSSFLWGSHAKQA